MNEQTTPELWAEELTDQLHHGGVPISTASSASTAATSTAPSTLASAATVSTITCS